MTALIWTAIALIAAWNGAYAWYLFLSPHKGHRARDGQRRDAIRAKLRAAAPEDESPAPQDPDSVRRNGAGLLATRPPKGTPDATMPDAPVLFDAITGGYQVGLSAREHAEADAHDRLTAYLNAPAPRYDDSNWQEKLASARAIADGLYPHPRGEHPYPELPSRKPMVDRQPWQTIGFAAVGGVHLPERGE